MLQPRRKLADNTLRIITTYNNQWQEICQTPERNWNILINDTHIAGHITDHSWWPGEQETPRIDWHVATSNDVRRRVRNYGVCTPAEISQFFHLISTHEFGNPTSKKLIVLRDYINCCTCMWYMNQFQRFTLDRLHKSSAKGTTGKVRNFLWSFMRSSTALVDLLSYTCFPFQHLHGRIPLDTLFFPLSSSSAFRSVYFLDCSVFVNNIKSVHDCSWDCTPPKHECCLSFESWQYNRSCKMSQKKRKAKERGRKPATLKIKIRRNWIFFFSISKCNSLWLQIFKNVFKEFLIQDDIFAVQHYVFDTSVFILVIETIMVCTGLVRWECYLGLTWCHRASAIAHMIHSLMVSLFGAGLT